MVEIVGQSVSHKAFGVGEITDFGGKAQNTNKYITVKFENKTIELQYPAAFEKHLTAMDHPFAKMVEKELEALNRRIDPPEASQETLPRPNRSIKRTVIQSTNTISKHQTSLIFKQSCGTNSKEIYTRCCDRFGWDEEKRYLFGSQGRPLYAKGATPEGYSAWFISHSNLTNTKGGSHTNTIVGNFICEHWDKEGEGLWDDKTTRAVFVKVDSTYFFYGVYRFCQVDTSSDYTHIKIYERIAENYPD